MQLEAPLVALCSASFVLYATTLVGFAWGWRRRRPPPVLERAPRVSILKPLAGGDDELQANLASFARLDYPSFEVLFGVASPDDPAFAAARAFVAAHPSVEARVVLTDVDAAVNPKVAQLIGLERAASGEVVVVSDSNVRVDPAYLWTLVGELGRPGIGLVSSLIAGTGESTLGAALENLQLGAVIAPQVVAAAALAGRSPTIGKSMALRRRDLARLGGFGAVAGVLAEDHLLGRLAREAGLGIGLVLTPVENRNVDCSLRRTLERHTRWAKLRRAIAPTAFALEPLLSPITTCAVAFAIGPSRTTAALLGVALVTQTLLAHASLRVVRGAGLHWTYAPLEIVRALVLFGCWLGGWSSRRVSWRGHPFVLGADSTIAPAPPRGRWRRGRSAARA